MRDAVSFSVPGSNSIHELQLGHTLIRFIDFDLNYFGEQCAQIYRQHASGEDVLDKALALKELLRNCHPYCAALLQSDLSLLALDCIIEHICVSEGTGLEGLWNRSMTEKDRFGRAIFSRITAYKTGFAINQWTNLRRMQAYAASKAAVVYGGPETESAVHKARKLYYDTAFRMTAAALGFGDGDLPYVKVSSVPFLPESTAMMKNAVNTLDPLIRKKTEGMQTREPLKGKDCVRDQMAGMALNLMMNMERPELDTLLQLIQTYGSLPNKVYEPSSFKAIIDLEFDQLVEKGYYLRAEEKGYTRQRYSGRKAADEKTETHIELSIPDAITEPAAVTAPDDTEKQQPAEEKLQAEEKHHPRQSHPAEKAQHAVKKQPAEQKVVPAETILNDLSVTPEEKAAAEPEPPANIKSVVADLNSGPGKVKTIIEMAEDPNRKESKKRTLQEVNMRCNLIWTSMNVRSGWSISSEEASEWFRYLTRLRYGIGTGELTPQALDKFLDATLEVYQLLPQDA